ncbi:hypothetical protein F5Y13DRAFT_203145 [Hypoxylon sp. FL1857]|nr:hypothetical protein F5Y13DRAFT_203145 [Hypoxylon sp. FL1857]
MDAILNSLNTLSSLPPEVQEVVFNGPALIQPLNAASNPDNPQSNKARVLAIAVVGQTIVTVAILLRVYAKIFVARRVFLEDILLFIGYPVIVLSLLCCYVSSQKSGFFVHQWNVLISDLPGIFDIVKLEICSYAIAFMALKSAILLEWARVFSPHRTQKSFFWTCHILLWINVLFYSTMVIMENIACPPQQNMDPIVQGICIKQTVTADITSTCLNLVSHILILVLPQKVIWQLNMTTQKKIGVSLVFAFGIMAVALGIWRLVVTIQYFTTTDMIFTVYEISLLRVGELTFVVLVFCIPAYPKIFRGRAPPGQAIASFWSRLSLLFTRRTEVDRESTQTSPRDNLVNSDGIHCTAEKTWNPRASGSTEQLRNGHNEISPGADTQGGITLGIESEIDLERCSG